MKTFLLTVSYDGTDYHGWQRQPGQKTVQSEIEKAISAVVGAPVTATASGRTDEGVHALGQKVSFSCKTSIPAASFAAALNTRLPYDIRAIDCTECAEGFCARKSAKRKTYVYRFYLSPAISAVIDRYALRVEKPFDIELIKNACTLIEGTHDFKEFYCLGSSAKTTVRKMFSCDFDCYPQTGITPPVYEFSICGEGFLYKTVRLLVGAIMQINSGKMNLEDFKSALLGNSDTPFKKIPAPAKGLWLKEVEYN